MQGHHNRASSEKRAVAKRLKVSEVFSLCADAIHRRTETANTRVIYRQVCSDIKKLASYGGRDEAHAIIQELREKTQRRPAFLEELQYISAKI